MREKERWNLRIKWIEVRDSSFSFNFRSFARFYGAVTISLSLAFSLSLVRRKHTGREKKEGREERNGNFANKPSNLVWTVHKRYNVYKNVTTFEPDMHTNRSIQRRKFHKRLNFYQTSRRLSLIQHRRIHKRLNFYKNVTTFYLNSVGSICPRQTFRKRC